MTNLARIISTISDPKITFSVFSIYLTTVILKVEDVFLILQILFIISIGLLSVALSRKYNHLDDYKFRNRKAKLTRAFILLMSLFYSIFLVSLSVIAKSRESIIFFSFYIFINIFFLTISYLLQFKFSAHIAFNGIIFLIIPNNYRYYAFIIFLIIVGYSRVKLKKHSRNQVLVTSFLVLFVFIIFDLIINVF